MTGSRPSQTSCIKGPFLGRNYIAVMKTLCFFLSVFAIVSAQFVPCQPNNVTVQGTIQYTCHNYGTQWINVPTGCISSSGQIVPVNGTYAEINSLGVGFQYVCEQMNSQTLLYRATGCLTNYNQFHALNDTFVMGSFQFTCVNESNNDVTMKPTGCVDSDGSIVQVGSSHSHCVMQANQQCIASINYACSMGFNNVVTYSCQNCTIGDQVVPIGDWSMIDNQQQCYCSNSGLQCVNRLDVDVD